MSWQTRSIVLALLSTWLPAFGLSPGRRADAGSLYPDPPHDFAHPDGPHAPLYSPFGGDLDRPVLIIYRDFDDIPVPAGQDSAWAATRVFGPGFPSLADYFRVTSFSELDLTPAPETWGEDNDGVVRIRTGSSSDFVNASQPDINADALVAADPHVDFAAMDANDDGFIDTSELLVIHMFVPTSANDFFGGARAVAADTKLDGKTLFGYGNVAMVSSAASLMTMIHEMAHAALETRDLYGFGVGSLDISGPTPNTGDTSFFAPSAWQKLHLYWLAPTVVTRDGYYQIDNAYTTGDAFLLFDPERGTDDYFLVENRQSMPGTYDVSISDSGLVIWRIKDSQYDSTVEAIRPIEIMRADGVRPIGCSDDDVDGSIDEDAADGVDNDGDGRIDEDAPMDNDGDGQINEDPSDNIDNDGDGAIDEDGSPDPAGCGGGSNGDAWDPADADPVSSGLRTMAAPWADGSPARVAVRAIGASGPSMRAYFDVRGPGILVDAAGPDGKELTLSVEPGEANPVAFSVMNTGEAPDSFTFTLTLPADRGWTASTETMELDAGESAEVTLLVNVPADEPGGVFSADIRGQSTTDSDVRSESPLRLRVVFHETAISYVGATAAAFATPAGFAAVVSDLTDPNELVSGATVEFRLAGVSNQVATAMTDENGLASSNALITVPPGEYELTVVVLRHGKHKPASTSVTYSVGRRTAMLTYGGARRAEWSDPVVFEAQLIDALTGLPITGARIDFALVTSVDAQRINTTTDDEGRAVALIVLELPAGEGTVTAEFAGDSHFLPAEIALPFSVEKENLTWAYTGDTLAALGTTPVLAAVATQEADGWPGALAAAEARFTLTPTLTAAHFEYQTGFRTGGAGFSIPATGLPVDLWTVTVQVPEGNPFFESPASPAVELVLYDPRGRVTGSGSGLDMLGKRASVEIGALYLKDVASGEVRFSHPVLGKFKGSTPAWIIVNGNQAILDVGGTLNAQSSTLRLRLADVGRLPAQADTFEVTIRDKSGALIYESGLVVIDRSDLQVTSQ